MLFFALLGCLIIAWLIWQLIRAKQFNQFKATIVGEFKEPVLKAVEAELILNRCDLFPNNDSHIQASQYYWTKSCTRILLAALKYQIIEEDWLKKTGNVRHCQHLFHLEQADVVSINTK